MQYWLQAERIDNDIHECQGHSKMEVIILTYIYPIKAVLSAQFCHTGWFIQVDNSILIKRNTVNLQ